MVKKNTKIVLLSLSVFSLVLFFAGSVNAQSTNIKPGVTEKQATRCKQFYKSFNILPNTITPGRQGEFSGNFVEGLPVICTMEELLLKAVNVGLGFAGGVAVLFIIVGGYWYLTAAGNDEIIEKGRKTLVNSIIGLVVIVLSAVIVRIVVDSLTLGGFSTGTSTAPPDSYQNNAAPSDRKVDLVPSTLPSTLPTDPNNPGIYDSVPPGELGNYDFRNYLETVTVITYANSGKNILFRAEIPKNGQTYLEQLYNYCKGDKSPRLEALINNQEKGSSQFVYQKSSDSWVAAISVKYQPKAGDQMVATACGEFIKRVDYSADDGTFRPVTPRN